MSLFTHGNYHALEKPARKKSFVGKIIIVLVMLFIGTAAVFAFKVVTAPEDIREGGIFTQIKHLVTSADRELRGEADDRINILLLGIGGGEHIGPLLTDTIMLVSVQPSTKKVAMISVPRDLLVDIPNIGRGKINHAYALIEASRPGSGGEIISLVIEDIFSLPVHYFVRVDFDGFARFIDELGGISVNVEQTLDDPYFPVAGKENATSSQRYEHLIIEKGIRYMNGETALKYVRSRMAYGTEGSDFARAKRQQKILLAIKDTALSPNTLFNIPKLNRTLNVLYDHIDTNLEFWEMLRVYDLGRETSSSNIINIVLDDGPTGPLKAETVDGAFVLVPKTFGWSDLQYIANNVFDQTKVKTLPIHQPIDTDNDTSAEDYRKKVLEKQKKEVRIEIQNGTTISGLAKRTADYLSGIGYHVVQFGNAPVKTYKKTLIYDLAPKEREEKKEVTQELETLFGAVVFFSGKPKGLVDAEGRSIEYEVNSEADMLIILGENWESAYNKLISQK